MRCSLQLAHDKIINGKIQKSRTNPNFKEAYNKRTIYYLPAEMIKELIYNHLVCELVFFVNLLLILNH